MTPTEAESNDVDQAPLERVRSFLTDCLDYCHTSEYQRGNGDGLAAAQAILYTSANQAAAYSTLDKLSRFLIAGRESSASGCEYRVGYLAALSIVHPLQVVAEYKTRDEAILGSALP